MTKKRILAQKRKSALKTLLTIILSVALGIFLEAKNSFIIDADFVETSIEARSDVSPRRSEENTTLPVEKVLAVMIETKQQENERKIREIAKEFDFKWENYLVNLACCEGLLKTDTINDKGNSPIGSRDRGLYGINDYWHSEVSDECAFDIRCSTIWTINHINNGKQHEFICDKRIRGVENFYKRCLN